MRILVCTVMKDLLWAVGTKELKSRALLRQHVKLLKSYVTFALKPPKTSQIVNRKSIQLSFKVLRLANMLAAII